MALACGCSGARMKRVAPRLPLLLLYKRVPEQSDPVRRRTPAHLRRALSSFAAHYHLDRPHQNIGNERIAPSNTKPPDGDKVVSDERLGGSSDHLRCAPPARPVQHALLTSPKRISRVRSGGEIGWREPDCP